VNDPIGTPERLIGADGEVACELRWSAWGKTEEAPGAKASTRIRFQGQYEDEETGLRYNRYRYYSLESGRFISPDPIGLAGTLNAYMYAPSPVLWFDPLGLALDSKLRHKLADINSELETGGNRKCKGQVDRREARKLGEAFVGPGYTTGRTRDGHLMLTSADGLRRYRAPSKKYGRDPETGKHYSRTGVQTNFESRPNTRTDNFENNVHLDIQ
jgi:RHS repeat-associated protein